MELLQLGRPHGDVLVPSFSYPIKRRDGERPLGILAAVVSLLTLYLALGPGLRSHDIRPILFYSLFCVLTALSAVVLGMQWRNERLTASEAGLTHSDWRQRVSTYPWSSVGRAVEKIRPDNRRLVLEMTGGRIFVIHADFPSFEDTLAYYRACLRREGKDVELDGGRNG